MVELRPGIWFVYREGYGRYAGAYPVTRQGWRLLLGLLGVIYTMIGAWVALLLRFGDGQSDGIWIIALCVLVMAMGMGMFPVVRRHTDYTITLAQWRARDGGPGHRE